MSGIVLPAWQGPPASGMVRGALRASHAFVSVLDDGEAVVVRVDPSDGAGGVFRDTPVIVTLSQPVDPTTIGRHTFRVEAGGAAEVPGRVTASPDGAVLIWAAEGPLVPGVVHFVAIAGLRDRRGQPVKAHVSRFVPCDITLSDLMTPGAS